MPNTADSESQNKSPSKIAFMTGATNGIGLVAAKNLLAQKYQLILTTRSHDKGQRIKKELISLHPEAQIEMIDCDVSSMQSSYNAAQIILEKYQRIDVLINNAGVAEMKYNLSEDGIEKTFASNHIGHFILTHHLLPLLKNSDDPRIVNTSSVGHYRGSKNFIDDINFKKRWYFVLRAYADSKLANVLFTKKLVRLLKDDGIKVNCFHPGHVATDIWPTNNWLIANFFAVMKKLFYITPEQGARPLIFLASSDKAKDINDIFYFKMQPREVKEIAFDESFQDALWDKSLQLCKNYLD